MLEDLPDFLYYFICALGLIIVCGILVGFIALAVLAFSAGAVGWGILSAAAAVLTLAGILAAAAT